MGRDEVALSADTISGLRCAGDGCRDRRRLVPDAEPGWVRCPVCGGRAAAVDLFRPYAAQTGRWIIGTAVLLSVGLTRGAGTQRGLLVAVGLCELGLVLWRIVYQARTLRRLRRGR